MLHEFLEEYEQEIIHLSRDKVLAARESKPTSALLDQGLPIFFKELIAVLRDTSTPASTVVPAACSMQTSGESEQNNVCETITKEGSAAVYGKESLRLGYTISQVVHTYGAVCQSITEFAQIKSIEITSQEFHDLNLCLDCAIAEAVTEFEKVQSEHGDLREAERLGFLIHELGNSLAIASLAYTMIRTGKVGNSGVTSQMVDRAFDRMRHLIDSSLAKVRLRGQEEIERTSMRLLDIVSEVEISASLVGKAKEISIGIDVNPLITLLADRHLIFSALSNLLNNAMKFTRKHGRVLIRSKESEGRILIEVEDECGGLPEGKTEELFKSFIQKGGDKTGLGLGLSLSRQAMELHQGKLTARDIPGKGCVFTIDLPKNP